MAEERYLNDIFPLTQLVIHILSDGIFFLYYGCLIRSTANISMYTYL